MRPTQLSLLVFYKEKEIADPSEFVMNICGLWDSMEFEPLKLYRRTTPIEKTKEFLQEVLAFSEKDVPSKHKTLMLKSSLKRDRVEVHFMFEHPNIKRITDPDYLGWQMSASSIGIYIPLNEMQADKSYDIHNILQVFFHLLSHRAIENACIMLISNLEFETDVHKQIFEIISGESVCIRKRQLDWTTFFTPFEYQKILQRFSETGNSLTAFCEENGLEILTGADISGVILKVKGPIEDTPEYFYSMLKRTREFYSILEPMNREP